MFDKEIEFSTQEDYFLQKEDYPIPVKLNIPNWYKELTHTPDRMTVKGCMPFLDTLTTGYLLKLPQDFHVRHNVDNKDEKGETFKDSFQTFGLFQWQSVLNQKGINLNSGLEKHSTFQMEDSPLVKKNKNLPFYKILNPWKIKTPSGYSCLFVPPLNNSDDRFSIIPGIVDTDTFPNEINFPMVINGDKYPMIDTIIKKGIPYVQIIPFKRETWKMKLTSRKTEEILNSRLFTAMTLFHNYKSKFWKMKKFK